MQYLRKTPFKYVMVQMFDVLFLCCGITCSEDQHGGIGDTQEGVIEEALQHWSVYVEAGGQILRADGCSTDEPRQALAHGQYLHSLPEQKKVDIL